VSRREGDWLVPPFGAGLIPKLHESLDFAVLPTSNDILHVKEAIRKMENRLTEVMLDPKPAAEQVAKLEERLTVLRAWIAPIRRLNHDVLSIVFELCAQHSPKTTLRISAVSRRWRQVILGTPRAWIYLDLYLCYHKPTVELFCERSRPHLFHARFNLSLPGARMSNVSDRIVCLSLRYIPYKLRVKFPNVTRLWIHHGPDVRLSEINTTVFPVLRHFVCGSPISGDGIGESTSPSGIAPLETLSLIITDEPTCLRVLKSSRSSLISLQLVLVGPFSKLPSRSQIVFPLLKSLEVINWAGGGDEWPFDLKTPALETYWQHSTDEERRRIMHPDISTIKQLRMDRLFKLPSLPKLKLLRARWGSDVLLHLRLISSDPTGFPELERIELEMAGNMSNDVLLTARNKETLRPILLSVQNRFRDMNGTVPTQMVRPRLVCFLPSC
jgi:hypothetical protein